MRCKNVRWPEILIVRYLPCTKDILLPHEKQGVEPNCDFS
jgi:hypothetical protein